MNLFVSEENKFSESWAPDELINFENVTLVARRRQHFRGVLADFFVAELPQKRGFLFHRNSLASCQLLSSECRRQIKTSLVVVMLLLRVMTYVIFYELF